MTTMRAPGVLERTRQRPIAALAATLLAATALVGTASMSQAADETEVVFDNSPSFDEQVHYPSQSWQYGIEQYGDIIELGGDARIADTASIWLNSWGCEEGTPSNGSCATTPGATYTTDMTLRIYAADSETIDLTSSNYPTATVPLVGEELAAVTQTITVPYRPDSNADECTLGDYYNADTDECAPAVSFLATFDLASLELELPDQVILALDKPAPGNNTTGNARAINVLLPGITSSAPEDPADYPENPDFGPSVGSDPAVNVNYVMANSQYGSALGEGVFGPAIWGPTYSPAFVVTASSPVTPEPTPDPTPDPTPEPGEPEPGETVTETVALGDTVVSFTAELGDHPSGDLVLSSSHSDNPAEFGELPGDAHFGFGAYSFELNVAVGSTATVTIVTESPANTLFKSIDNEWSKYPATFDGTAITFDLVDGGAGDADGEANGIIVDPVAPAVMATFTG